MGQGWQNTLCVMLKKYNEETHDWKIISNKHPSEEESLGSKHGEKFIILWKTARENIWQKTLKSLSEWLLESSERTLSTILCVFAEKTNLEMVRICPDCPVLLPLNNSEGLKSVREATAEFNKNTSNQHYYILKEVGRISTGVQRILFFLPLFVNS